LPAAGQAALDRHCASPAVGAGLPRAVKAQLRLRVGRLPAQVCRAQLSKRREANACRARRVGRRWRWRGPLFKCSAGTDVEMEWPSVNALCGQRPVSFDVCLFSLAHIFGFQRVKYAVVCSVVLHRTQHYRSACSHASNAALPIVVVRAVAWLCKARHLARRLCSSGRPRRAVSCSPSRSSGTYSTRLCTEEVSPRPHFHTQGTHDLFKSPPACASMRPYVCQPTPLTSFTAHPFSFLLAGWRHWRLYESHRQRIVCMP